MIFFITIVAAFVLFIVAVRVHKSYIIAVHHYNKKLVDIAQNSIDLENTTIEILNVTRRYREERALIKQPCARDPEKECDICDTECIFRRTDENDK